MIEIVFNNFTTYPIYAVKVVLGNSGSRPGLNGLEIYGSSSKLLSENNVGKTLAFSGGWFLCIIAPDPQQPPPMAQQPPPMAQQQQPPPMAQQPPPQMAAAAAQQQVITLQVPPNAPPGAIMQVPLPDGQMMQVQIPMNAQPGMLFQVPIQAPAPQQPSFLPPAAPMVADPITTTSSTM